MLRALLILLAPLVLMACPAPASTQDTPAPPDPDPGPAPGTVFGQFESGGCTQADGEWVCTVTVGQIEGTTAGTPPLSPGETLTVHVSQTQFQSLDPAARAALEHAASVELVIRTEERMGTGLVWTLVRAAPLMRLAPPVPAPAPAPAPGTALVLVTGGACAPAGDRMACTATVERVLAYGMSTPPLTEGERLAAEAPTDRFSTLGSAPRAALERGDRVRLVVHAEEQMGAGTVWTILEAHAAD